MCPKTCPPCGPVCREQTTATALPAFPTIAEVAERLRVSERTVHRWLANDELVAHDFGRAKRIGVDDLTRFITARRGR